MTKNLKALGLLMLLMSASPSMAQGIKPLPSLHTEGRYVVDKHGNHVVLHGVMDTPVNMKFYKAGSTSGIHDIRVESFDSDAVYNLQGVRIGTKADMEHLPRGIYIIGGKKIIK